MKTVAEKAMKDITKDIQDEYGNRGNKWFSKNVITPKHLYNKGTRQMNRELGIDNINYFGNKNATRKK